MKQGAIISIVLCMTFYCGSAAHAADTADSLTSPTASVSITVNALPPAVKGVAHALAPMMIYRSDEPLARIEWVDSPE